MALVIFDLDGTLMDSIDGLAISMNKVLAIYGLDQHPVEAYKHFVGNGIKMMVERALPAGKEALIEEALEKMIEIYKVDYIQGLKVYDGIYPILEALVDQGHQIAMVTNKFQFMADRIMPDFFSQYPFTDIIGRSEEHPAKPDPTTINEIVLESGLDKNQCYMVGDTEVDIRVARNAGIEEVFVTWGFRKLHEVAELSPKNVIDHPSELMAIVSN